MPYPGPISGQWPAAAINSPAEVQVERGAGKSTLNQRKLRRGAPAWLAEAQNGFLNLAVPCVRMGCLCADDREPCPLKYLERPDVVASGARKHRAHRNDVEEEGEGSAS